MSAGYTRLSTSEAAEVIAADGSSVLPLCAPPGAASFACFELKPWQMSQAVSHATAEGNLVHHPGKWKIWRSQDRRTEITTLVSGMCLTIPQIRIPPAIRTGIPRTKRH